MSRFFKDALIVGFALFAMFFGAGNIIFPPYVGLIAGKEWLTGFFWYYMADIGLALIAIIGMLRARRIDQIEGIMYRLGKIPARIMISIILICIGPLIAIPRTAVVGYEMLIKANSFDISILAFVVVYFLIAFSLSIRESSLVDIVGKVLTRKSMARLFDNTRRMRPSCGTRFSAIFSREMTLMREAIFSLMTSGGDATSRSTPSVRNRMR